MENKFFKDCTLSDLDTLFGLQQAQENANLNHWTQQPQNLSNEEKSSALRLQNLLIKNASVWNEQELSLHFIGPMFSLIDFTEPYRFNLFAQRPLSSIVNDVVLSGKPDGMIASGYRNPEKPFFCFHEYKKEIDNSGDPAGQCLAAMLVGQALNLPEQKIIYGCYVIGRDWYFMVLDNKHYAISNVYPATTTAIFDILQILKTLLKIIQQLTA